ncbi:hypothetical protein BDY21DRAFT_415202 [Lineolata rhizophorae]|uniref:Filamentation protein n=1 Tax=Lineolata rhizophorae TaxID=578093 RepID=A0A6A6P0S3_9PEZI|nr:hypothetical protein BDY21DRAFT_415202 [Lineolata rhizophorae]
MSRKESDKAQRYIAQLDAARCNGRWDEVPELVRKIEKHAPGRKCLALTARSEAQVATWLRDPAHQRPSTAASTTEGHSLFTLIPPLLAALEEETEHGTDAFEARICLGWVHWVLDEPRLAVARLPRDFAPVVAGMMRPGTGGGKSGVGVIEWPQTCVIKGAYLKGRSQEKTASIFDAVQTYSAVLPFLAALPSLEPTNPQFRLWTERLLKRLCLISNQAAPTSAAVDIDNALFTFRTWAKLFEKSPLFSTSAGLTPPAAPTTIDPDVGITRRQVWKAYYDTLSTILHRGLLYTQPTRDGRPRLHLDSERLPEEQLLAARLQQRAELKRVEATYESMLLQETRFPKASANNEDVETWVDAVMRNWKVLCGQGWRDEELGEGGKGGVGRGVLDILYRATTKTFHSTQILRHLFTIHASLAEFDLAIRAFESYTEILTRGKERCEKSGESDPYLDSDETFLLTTAEAIRTLCRFGDPPHAEKAKEIGDMLETWVAQHLRDVARSKSSSPNPSATPADSDIETTTTNPNGASTPSQTPPRAAVPPRALAAAYRAVGISRAHWARLTHDAGTRAEFQTSAVRFLKKALEPRYEDQDNVDTLYALGLTLAHMRQTSAAVKVVKRALAVPATPIGGEYARERRLIPLWHLLALLLSAKSEYHLAAKATAAAFEQFSDPAVLFGAPDAEATLLQQQQQQQQPPMPRRPRGVVDRMEALEKEGILQIKITQLAILEAVEGPAAAVDASDELLSLYARLFGDPANSKKEEKPPATTASTVKRPKSSAGTIKNSIFGRSKSTRKSAASSLVNDTSTFVGGTATPTLPIDDARPGTARRESVKLKKKSAGSLRRKTDGAGSRRSSIDGSVAASEQPPLPAESQGATRSRATSVARPSTADRNAPPFEPGSTTGQPLQPIPHNTSHKVQPPPAGHSKQPPEQDTRLPVPAPTPSGSMPFAPGPAPPRGEYTAAEPRFPTLAERRHRLSLLADVWLFIAGLYVRSGGFEDAKAAIDEAASLAEQLERDVVALESASATNFARRNWGAGKSVDECWADVWAARGEVAVARLGGSPQGKLEAMPCWEKALRLLPDHKEAVVSLSGVLLDVFERMVPHEMLDEQQLGTSVPPNNEVQLQASSIQSTPRAPHDASWASGAEQHGSHKDNDEPATRTEGAERGVVRKDIHMGRQERGGNHDPDADEGDDGADVENPSAQSYAPASSATGPDNTPSPLELHRLAARDRAYGLLSTLTKLGDGWDCAEAWFALARAYEVAGEVARAKEVLWWVVELEESRPVRGWEEGLLSGVHISKQ